MVQQYLERRTTSQRLDLLVLLTLTLGVFMVDTSNPVKQLNKNVELARDLGTPNEQLESIASSANQEIKDSNAIVRAAEGFYDGSFEIANSAKRLVVDTAQDIPVVVEASKATLSGLENVNTAVKDTVSGALPIGIKAAFSSLKDVLQEIADHDPQLETPFDPVNNKDHSALFNADTQGMSPEDSAYKRLYTADTIEEYERTKQYLVEQDTKNAELATLGFAGAAGSMFAVDLDWLIPSLKVSAAVKMSRLNKALDSGLISKEVYANASKNIGVGTSKLSAIGSNITENVAIDTAGAVILQQYDPSMDNTAILHAALLGGSLGAGIGALSPTKPIAKASDITDATLDRAVLDAHNAELLAKEKALNDAINFTSKWEGGYVNDPTDKGGETILGISKANFPKEFSEAKALYDQDPRKAKKYQRKFFKQLFSTVAGETKLTPNQIMVLQDTIPLFGQPKAKEFFRKANGDPVKMIALRKAHHAKVIKNNPEQAKFEKGWENRNNDLLATIRGEGTLPNPEERIRQAIDEADSAADAKVRAKYTVQDNPDEAPRMDLSKSVGAAAISGNPVVIPNSSKTIIESAQEYIAKNELLLARLQGRDDFYAQEADTAIGKITQNVFNRVYKAVSATPFQTDYDRLFNVQSDVAKMLTHKLLVDPLARVVNNRSGHDVAELIQRNVNALYTPNAELHYKAWYKAQGFNRRDIVNYEFGARAKFDKELFLYREAINQGRTPPKVHESIVAASNNLDAAYEQLLNYAKKHGVENFENIEFKRGHNPRSWNGHIIAKTENMAEVGTKKLVRSLQKAILAMTEGLNKKTSELYAKAIIRHAKNKQLGNPVGALGTVSDDGVIALQRILMDESPSLKEAEALDIAKSLLYQNSDRGTLKSSRSRINLDTSYPIEGTDMTIADLLDQNTYELTTKLVRTQANAAALAFHGIQKRDLPQYKQAIIDEVNANGGNAAEAAEIFDNIMSYFGDGAFAGGSGVIANRINKTGLLAYLGQVGISQIAELGATLGVVGIKSWVKFAGKSIKAMLAKTEPELMKSMLSSEKYVGDASLIYRGQKLDDVNNYTFDASNIASLRDLLKYVMDTDESGSRNISSKLGSVFDTATDRLSVAQGIISGFDKINQMLQMTAALSIQDYIVRAIKNGTDSARLKTMGVDDEVRAMINKHITLGNIKFDESGSVIDMGIQDWDFPEQELMQMINRRNVDQALQKAARGETQYWTYQTLGSLFSNLKSFVYTATHKQLLRNARLADPESFMLLLATLGTGGLVYSAKQILNGNSDSLDAESVALGAIQWSNITSPIYGAVDPLAYMLGISGGNFRDFSGGTFTIPAGITASYSLANLPRVIGRPVTQVLSGEEPSWGKVEKDALKVLPLNRAFFVPQIIKVLEE